MNNAHINLLKDLISISTDNIITGFASDILKKLCHNFPNKGYTYSTYHLGMRYLLESGHAEVIQMMHHPSNNRKNRYKIRLKAYYTPPLIRRGNDLLAVQHDGISEEDLKLILDVVALIRYKCEAYQRQHETISQLQQTIESQKAIINSRDIQNSTLRKNIQYIKQLFTGKE